MTSSGERLEQALSRALWLMAPTATVVVATECIVVGSFSFIAHDMRIPLA